MSPLKVKITPLVMVVGSLCSSTKRLELVYKPAWFEHAKGIRFMIDDLCDHPEIVDPYGSFLYIR